MPKKESISLQLLPHVNRTLQPDSEEAQKMTEQSGQLLLNSLENYRNRPDGSALRMFVVSLISRKDWRSNKRLLTWKILVTKSNRLLYQLAPLMPCISENESGLLQTTKSMLPTPDASDRRSKNSKQQGVSNVVSGTNPGLKLQPAFALWMMGFPETWCDLEDGEQMP